MLVTSPQISLHTFSLLLEFLFQIIEELEPGERIGSNTLITPTEKVFKKLEEISILPQPVTNVLNINNGFNK